MPKYCGLGSDVCPASHTTNLRPLYIARIVEQKPFGIPKRRRATIRAPREMESKTFAKSSAKNDSDPFFTAQVCSNKRRATNKAFARPRPVRKPNCVDQIFVLAPVAFNLQSKIVTNSL